MTWTCAQTETHLSDYLDGFLEPSQRSAFEAHVSLCQQCAPLLASVSNLLGNLHSLEAVEPPPNLIYSILDKTLGPRETVTGWRALLARMRGLANLRLAYGVASVAATFMIVVTAFGFSWRKPKFADLAPASIYRNADRQAHLVYARGSKFVSDLRVVYEIQSRLSQDEPMPTTPERSNPEATPNKAPGRTDGTNPASPKQQNRANGLGRNIQLLASELAVATERRNP
ncbi:MAG TPA: zf-HC2 domain-containing protein [Candidatus Dormibacteraeota bacterium]|nr:zf-HC2 domain-containing protein [Candidatus Dormibacteraeota bacterium]